MRRLSKSSKVRLDCKNLIAPRTPVNIIGLNSGTSGDGLDAVLVQFDKNKLPKVLMCETYKYTRSIRKKITEYGEPGFVDGLQWLKLDFELGNIMGRFTRVFLSRIRKAGKKAGLIASHGQTIRHLPFAPEYPLTLQIGDSSCIAQIAGLPVIADFRRSDLAAGGQGAPLSPVLHEYIFRYEKNWRAIVNIGGIANITILPPTRSGRSPAAGDCGPGNMAIDLAMVKLFNKPYDKGGRTALSGIPRIGLVSRTLRRKFFILSPPKSTGREQFGQGFVDQICEKLRNVPGQDIVSTITEITVRGIADFLNRFAEKIDEIYLCGGGAKNDYIVSRLRQLFPRGEIETTAALGYDPDYVEAVLWAYLAYRFVNKKPIDTSGFTGASRPYIPGRLCFF